MKFEKDFNPGHHNTYTEVNFGPNSQYLPNVTELTIINGDKEYKRPSGKVVEPDQDKDLVVVKAAILNYVNRIAPLLKKEWMNGWERFWKGLLDIDVIENEICRIGKQQGTTFNRNFVCKVIHYLACKDFYNGSYNPSEMTRALEHNDQHAIRTTALCYDPDESVCKRIDNYVDNFKL